MRCNANLNVRIRLALETPLDEISTLVCCCYEFTRDHVMYGSDGSVEVECQRGPNRVGLISFNYVRSKNNKVTSSYHGYLFQYELKEGGWFDLVNDRNIDGHNEQEGWTIFIRHSSDSFCTTKTGSLPYTFRIHIQTTLDPRDLPEFKTLIDAIKNPQPESMLTLESNVFDIHIYLPKFRQHPIGLEDNSWVIESEFYTAPREIHVKTVPTLSSAVKFVYPFLERLSAKKPTK